MHFLSTIFSKKLEKIAEILYAEEERQNSAFRENRQGFAASRERNGEYCLSSVYMVKFIIIWLGEVYAWNKTGSLRLGAGV